MYRVLACFLVSAKLLLNPNAESVGLENLLSQILSSECRLARPGLATSRRSRDQRLGGMPSVTV